MADDFETYRALQQEFECDEGVLLRKELAPENVQVRVFHEHGDHVRIVVSGSAGAAHDIQLVVEREALARRLANPQEFPDL